MLARPYGQVNYPCTSTVALFVSVGVVEWGSSVLCCVINERFVMTMGPMSSDVVVRPLRLASTLSNVLVMMTQCAEVTT